ncbi:MAG: Uncharacterized protein G01um101472_302, partial [Parcubacteria group bacterium Gr01-1014_72]
MERAWYEGTTEELLRRLATSEQGLTAPEAARRLREQGENILPEAPQESAAAIFLRQFKSPLIYTLFLAAAIIFTLGETADAAIILFVLIFNAVVGAVQEGRAAHTLRALKNFVATNATVVRGERELVIPDREVVTGDIILLTSGDRVPADARLIEANALTTDEAALTGESEPVEKTDAPLPGRPRLPVETENIVFRGTYVLTGVAKALVVATGEQTVIGNISKGIAGVETEVPLRTDIRNLSRLIVTAVGIIGSFIFIAGLIAGKPVREMFTTVISLAVSIIPEGLPIVLTLVLAVGVF